MRIAWVVCFIAASAVPAIADDSARPDPRELLRKANEAAAKLTAVSYDAEFRGEGAIANQIPTVKGRIIAQRGETPDRPKVRIEGQLAEPGSHTPTQVKFASDGNEAFRIEEARRLFLRGNTTDAVSPELNALLPPKYLVDAPFRTDIAVSEVIHEGVEEVDGVECDKLKIIYDPVNRLAMTYWFGRKDHLLRRLENNLQLRIPGKPGPQVGRIIFSTSNLSASPAINGDTFSFSAPEGYRSDTFAPKPRIGTNNLLAAGNPAPEWELKTADGRTVSLKSLRNKVVVLDFWASWCGPCKIAMPGIEKLHQRMKGKPVEVVGINCRQRQAPIGDAHKVIADLGLTYTQVFDGDQVAEDYRVGGIPCLYVIGPDGKIAWSVSGWQPGLDETLAKLIEEILQTEARKKAAE